MEEWGRRKGYKKGIGVVFLFWSFCNGDRRKGFEYNEGEEGLVGLVGL